MTPFFLNKLSSFPPADGDQDQSHLHAFPSATDCSSPYTFLFNNPLVEGAASSDHHRDHHKVPPKQEPNEHLLVDGLRDHPDSISYYTNNHDDFDDGSVKHLLYDQHVREDEQHGSANWMSSKMRFMRKMMDAGLNVATKPRRNRQVSIDQKYPNQEISSDSRSNNSEDNFPTGVVRVCSSCNTTKTPLWRSGPQGPKSLCNACGIRQRKARQAMAAATVSGGLISIDTSSKTQKEKISDVDRTVPLKKRYNIATTGATATAKKLRLDDIMINLGKTSAFHQVFPQDEKDAAILLMGLSCDLSNG